MNAKALEKMFSGPAGWALALGAGAVAVYVLYKVVGSIASKAASVAGGVVSGNNVLTQNQLDLQGNPVTAYQGAGVLGTAGAAANTASGGLFASIGDWLGGKTYDLFNGSSTPLAGPNGAGGTGSNVAGSASSDGSASDINFGLIDGAADGW
jgi:hypothetical protein